MNTLEYPALERDVFDWLPGINIVLVSSEVAKNIDYCDRLNETLPKHARKQFGSGEHHSRIIDMWSVCIDAAGTIIPSVFHVENPHVMDKSPLKVELLMERTVLLDTGGLRRYTEAEKQRFTERYEVGIQHISEILITAGMW